jgi:hypothetical protein
LIKIYLGIATLSFMIMIALSAGFVFSFANLVIKTSEENLKDQIHFNSKAILSDASAVFIEEFNIGASFAKSMAIALGNVWVLGSSYSVNSLPSYPDTTTPDVDLQAPVTYHDDDSSVWVYANRQRRYLARGISVGGNNATVGASSVYLYGFKSDNSNVQPLMAQHASLVNTTSYMDQFCRMNWQRNPTWLNAYVSTEEAGMFRRYPGSSTFNGSFDGYGTWSVRTYDPRKRAWYLDTKALSQGEIHVTNPYVDAFGKGLLMSLCTPVYAGVAFKGVAGSDLVVAMVQSLVEKIKSGKTGQAHLFSISGSGASDGVVLASPQWQAWGATTLIKYSQIVLCPSVSSTATFSDSIWLQLKSGGNAVGNFEAGGCFLDYQRITPQSQTAEAGSTHRFVIVISTPLSEVMQAVDKNKDEVNSSALALFGTSSLICAGCWGFIVCMVIMIAIALASPLKGCEAEAMKIASNIGKDDLFESVDIEQNHVTKSFFNNIGEVSFFQVSFMSMLVDLFNKRISVSQDVLNPLSYQCESGAEERLFAIPGYTKLLEYSRPIPHGASTEIDKQPLTLNFRSNFCEDIIVDHINRNDTIHRVIQAHVLPKFRHLGLDKDPLRLRLCFGGQELQNAAKLCAAIPDISSQAELSVVEIDQEEQQPHFDHEEESKVIDVQDKRESTKTTHFNPFTPEEPKWYNMMSTHLGMKLVVPILITTITITIILNVVCSNNGKEWVKPVREWMVREDEQALTVRAYEKSQMMAKCFKRAENSLNMCHEYMHMYYNGSLGIRSSYQQYFDPTDSAPPGADASIIGTRQALSADARMKGRQSNYDLTAWFQDISNQPQTPNTGGVTLQVLNEDMKSNSALQNAMLPIFKGNDIIESLYIGFQNTKAFIQSPYEYFDWTKTYTSISAWDGSAYIGYDPTKRPWYKNASVASDGDPSNGENAGNVYNGVDLSSNTGNAYIALSRAVRTNGAGSPLKGVISVDMSMKALQDSLDTFRTRSDGTSWSGYGYFVSAQGHVALHPSVPASVQRSVEDAEFGKGSSLDKTRFVQTIKPLLLDVSIESSFSLFDKNGAKWAMAFHQVTDTPYVLVLAVQYSDLTKAADDLQESVDAAIGVLTGIAFAITAVIGIILGVATHIFGTSIAAPMQQLAWWV